MSVFKRPPPGIDQFDKGSDFVLGHTGLDLCPVTTILRYIETRKDQPGQFFLDSVITKSRFTSHICKILGLPQHQYTGHSFRIGAATTATLAGVEDSTFQAFGRWNSLAFLLYVRTPKEQLVALSGVMARMRSRPNTQQTQLLDPLLADIIVYQPVLPL